LVKNRRGERRVNILKSVIDIPFHILGKKCEGGEHKKQQLGIGICLNPPTLRSTKEIARNGRGKRLDMIQKRPTRVPKET